MLPESFRDDVSFISRRVYPPRHRGAYFMAIIFFVIMAAGYISFRTSSFFLKPTIELEAPRDGAKFPEGAVLIHGQADPHSTLSINGYEVFSDERGKFKTSIFLQEGFHIIDIRARNRLGKESRIVRHVVIE